MRKTNLTTIELSETDLNDIVKEHAMQLASDEGIEWDSVTVKFDGVILELRAVVEIRSVSK